MKYATPQAFRQALEERLRRDHPQHRIPRLRKMIAFERFMAHLNDDASRIWNPEIWKWVEK